MVDINYNKSQIEKFQEAIVSIPDKKTINQSNPSERIEDFCVFILSFGRSDRVITYNTLFKESKKFSQEVYIVCSDDDSDLPNYIEKFGDKVVVFNKDTLRKYIETGDNFDKMSVILYARNICWAIANKLGYRYFVEFDDDYSRFSQRFVEHTVEGDFLRQRIMYNIDFLCKIHLDLLKLTHCRTIAFSQNGDYIGGAGNGDHARGWKRKVMNSFFCDTEKPFLFAGSINEDVNYYSYSGRVGVLNYSMYGYSLNQGQTQSNAGGMTEQYVDSGTYVKSFYSIMFSPSCVKISVMGNPGKEKRIHHRVIGENCYVKVLDEKYKYESYNKIHNAEDEW